MHCSLVFLLFTATAFSLLLSSNGQSYAVNYPVILIPGDGGSQLQAKLDKPEVMHDYCVKKTNDWFNLWLNVESLTPYFIDCFVDNMRLEYNETSRRSRNAPGVRIRVPGFGNTTTVEFFDPSHIAVSTYFATLVTKLISVGYRRGVTVLGAPYDFRLAPNQLNSFYARLEQIIEQAYYINGRQRVALVAHSMGSPVIAYFLNQKDADWKEKFIHVFISLAGCWGGAVKTMRLQASGHNLGVISVRNIAVRKYQRSAPSTAFLMPSKTLWGPDEPLVVTPYRNYTAHDFEDFFRDLNYSVGYELRKDTEPLLDELKPPGVEFHALHGTMVETVSTIFYTKKKWPDKSPKELSGDHGDGTVNYRSLKAFRRWMGQQKQPIYEMEYPGVSHAQILDDVHVHEYILKVLYS